MNPLDPWIRMAREHWKEFLPRRYAEFEAAGKLDEALRAAAEQTYLEMSQLEESGFQPDEAFQMVREEYLLLKPEDSDPEPAGSSLMQEALEAVRSGRRSLDA